MSNKDEMLELAFGLIANAMDDMLDINNTRKMEWYAAALKFRDQYHEMLRLKKHNEEGNLTASDNVITLTEAELYERLMRSYADGYSDAKGAYLAYLEGYREG